MNPLIINIYIGITMFLISVMLHELGHFIYLRYMLNRDVEIRFCIRKGKAFLGVGKPEDYEELHNFHLKMIYLSGILLGFFPLLLLIFVDKSYLILWILYLIGNKKDIKNLVKR